MEKGRKTTTAKATTATVELATIGANVPEIMQVLDAKLKTMDDVRESKYKTSGVLDSVDIKKEKNIEALIRIYGSVMARESIYNESAKELGITTYPSFEISGGSSADWKADIKLRIKVINQKETVDKLVEYKDKMSKFLSEQDQKDMLMKEMSDFFGKI